MKSYPIYLLYTMCIFTVVAHAQQCGTKDDYHTGHTYDFTLLDFVMNISTPLGGNAGGLCIYKPCGSCDASRIPSCQS